MDPCFRNPVTGELYGYVCASDTYREVVVYTNKLYEEGLLWQECITATSEQRDALRAQGHHVIEYGYPDSLAKYNALMKDTVPEVDWTWTEVQPSIDPNRRMVRRNIFANADMMSFLIHAAMKKWTACVTGSTGQLLKKGKFSTHLV